MMAEHLAETVNSTDSQPHDRSFEPEQRESRFHDEVIQLPVILVGFENQEGKIRLPEQPRHDAHLRPLDVELCAEAASRDERGNIAPYLVNGALFRQIEIRRVSVLCERRAA